MKGKFAYIALETTTILMYFLLAAALYAQASDVSHIAFSSKRDGNYDIYMMDTKGKNLQKLTNHPGNEYSPAFSPDGRWMAYVSNRDGNLEVYVMYLNTRISHRLTWHSRHDVNPAWSPDGSLTPIF